MHFTEKLDSLMRQKGLNKSQFARAAGIPYTTVDGFYKQGAENIKLSTLKKIAEYFNCSLDFLVNTEEPEAKTLDALIQNGSVTDAEIKAITLYVTMDPGIRKEIVEHFTRGIAADSNSPTEEQEPEEPEEPD